MTYAHVVLGEVVPKNLAIDKADRLAVIVAPVLLVFYRVSEVFVFVIERSAGAVSRMMGLRTTHAAGGHSAEELKFIITSSRHEGHLSAFEAAAMNHLIEMDEFVAREIMVPRNEIISVPVDASFAQVLRVFLEYQFSRLPVYQKQAERIVGIVHYKDLLRTWEERRVAVDKRRPVRPFQLQRIMRKPLVLPETKPLSEVLEELTHAHMQMALVVDEFGTISGLLTFEDVLEHIFGEIEDEHDEHRAQPPAGETAVIEVDGTISLRDLETQYGITVDLPEDAGFETLRRIPALPVWRDPESGGRSGLGRPAVYGDRDGSESNFAGED